MNDAEPLWCPDPAVEYETLLARFQNEAQTFANREFATFKDLHNWSVQSPSAFWSLAWEFCGLRGGLGDAALVPNDDPMQARFFPGAQLNVVESFLKNADDREAIVFIAEDRLRVVWTRAQLKQEVAALASALRAEGIVAGDRVVGYVPAKIFAVPDIPRTKSGKTAELAVRDVVNNRPVRNVSGLANPQALTFFTNHPDLNT